jgi:spermidine synthase
LEEVVSVSNGINVLAREETERGELVLRRRDMPDSDAIYEIIFNGVFLMASTNAPSARQLAFQGLNPLAGKRGMSVLVGGLGMGCTLQAVLEHASVEQVRVVELEPLIVEWARTHFGPLNSQALDDQRTEVVVADLARYLETAEGRYDAILLDVDNGPAWLVFEQNAAVYCGPALERMRDMLNPGGVLAVWAAECTPSFLEDLERTFAWADEVVVQEMDERGRPVDYYIYRGGAA